MSAFPRILAQRPGGALLVALDERSGCVYEPHSKVAYPRLPLASLLAQPYWHAYHGDSRVLHDWPGPPPVTSMFPQRPPEHSDKKESDQ